MNRGLILPVIVLFCAVCIGGCATAEKGVQPQNESQLQSQVAQLKNEVSSLEAQILAKAKELNNLKDELNKVEKEKEALSVELAKKKILGEAQARPNIEQVKVALINAGYQPGVINMKMEIATFNAIRAFQKANNLMPDGVVGKKTWAALKKYLYGKTE